MNDSRERNGGHKFKSFVCGSGFTTCYTYFYTKRPSHLAPHHLSVVPTCRQNIHFWLLHVIHMTENEYFARLYVSICLYVIAHSFVFRKPKLTNLYVTKKANFAVATLSFTRLDDHQATDRLFNYSQIYTLDYVHRWCLVTYRHVKSIVSLRGIGHISSGRVCMAGFS